MWYIKAYKNNLSLIIITHQARNLINKLGKYNLDYNIPVTLYVYIRSTYFVNPNESEFFYGFLETTKYHVKIFNNSDRNDPRDCGQIKIMIKLLQINFPLSRPSA